MPTLPKSAFRQLPFMGVIRVNVDDPGVRYDIDTPSDYDKMRLP